MKRNYVQEIEEIRERQLDTDRKRAFGNRYNSLVMALCGVDRLHGQNQGIAETELLRHFPCSIVALIESCFRLWVRDLIDAGEPFRGRATTLVLTPGKFSLDVILSLNEKRVSAGDLVSHLVSLNNFGDIKEAMAALTTEDFAAKLKKAKPGVGVGGQTLEQTMPRFEGKLDELFRTRHILCHEFGASTVLTISIAAGFLQTSLHVAFGTEFLMSEVFLPQTQKTVSAPSK